MFGVLFALFCLVALVRLWRRPFGRGFAYAGGGCGGWVPHGPAVPFGARAWSHDVMRDVDATPSQERAIHDTVSDLTSAVRDRQHAWGLADVVAEALEADVFDRSTLSARLERDELERFRATVVPAVERLHAALEPGQRKKVARRLRGNNPLTN